MCWQRHGIIFGSRFSDFERFASIFTNTGIVKRHGVKPFEWYLEPRGWPERTAAFLEGAEALYAEVAGKALANAGLSPGDRHGGDGLLHQHRQAESRRMRRPPHGFSI
jgi:hypothetical protein